MLPGTHQQLILRIRELLLCLACLMMWSQVTGVNASPQPVKSTVFRKLPMPDVTFTQDVLWEKPTKSKLDCGRMCNGEARCVMFTFTPSTDGPGGSCRVHGKRQTPQGEQEQAPGARSYSIAFTDFWIKTKCAQNADCTEPMAACFFGKCLCDGGFFFDYTQNACVSTCAWRLGDTYLQYHGWDLNENDIYNHLAQGDITTCFSTCTDDPECIGIVYSNPYDKCYFKNVTAQDHPENWIKEDNAIYYQKTCI